MHRIPFKGLFIILIPCILLVGVIVPLAVFAKAPAHSSPIHSSSVQSSDELKSRLFPINIAATCNIPNQNDNPEVLFTFQSQAEVTGLARIVSADTGEAQEEVLVLKETKGPFTMTVQPNTGPHPFKFTATKNGDQLTACYTLIGHDDESDMTTGTFDHPGAVSFTVEYGGVTQNSDELKSRLFPINIAAICTKNSYNPEVLFTFQGNAEVTGLARMVSADTGEAQEEVLVLKETKGPFTMTVQPNTGPHPFEFTATKSGDQLTACYTLIGHDDESDMTTGTFDHPGAVSFTVEY